MKTVFEIKKKVLVKYNGSDEHVIIPKEIEIIGEEAFKGNPHVQTVKLSGAVKKIGYEAFAECPYLSKVNIPNSVKEIGAGAFNNSPKLNLNIDSGNNYSQIDSLIIKDGKVVVSCTGKKSVVNIPNGIEEIDIYSFKCDTIESIKVPSTVKYIYTRAITDCINLRTVNIPQNTTIQSRNFQNCPKIELNFAKNSNYIQEDSLVLEIDKSCDTEGQSEHETMNIVGYTGRSSRVVIPESVKSIDSDIFADCNEIQYLVVPGSVEKIEVGSFNGCGKLAIDFSNNENFRMENSLVINKENQIISCTGRITDVVVPDSVTSISRYAFARCKTLSSVIYQKVFLI